jgi:glutaredoxin 3
VLKLDIVILDLVIKMAEIVIYTTNYCPYCVKAKQLLIKKGVEFEEFDLTNNDEARIALVEKSGGRKTVPQIFINDQHIGGCDDLYALDAKGELDTLLK